MNFEKKNHNEEIMDAENPTNVKSKFKSLINAFISN